MNPNKSLRAQLFLNFLIPIVILGVLVFGFVKVLSSHIIDSYLVPQFESTLEDTGDELVQAVDDYRILQAIRNPEGNHAGLLKTMDSIVEDNDKLKHAYILTQKEGKGYSVSRNGSGEMMVESPLTKEQKQALDNKQTVMTDFYKDPVDGDTHKSIVIPLENSDAVAGVDMDGSFIMTLENSINVFLIAFLILALLLGALFAYVFGGRLNKSIQILLGSMKRIRDGDLTGRVEVKRQDEIGQLANAVNDMVDGLRSLVKRVSQASNDVAGRSMELTHSANEVKEGSGQVASTMQELSSGAESQANSSGNLSVMMDRFTLKIKEADQTGKEIAGTSHEVLQMTDEGRKLMQQSVHQMNKIHTIVKDAVDKVQGLEHQSKEITNLVQVIQAIADQTNLLSLNAAIEAARAGEHGKGFAVVAGEVRKLAEQVSSSIGSITKIVHTIQQESTNVAGSLESGYKEVTTGSEQLEQTEGTFLAIQGSVTQMAERIKHISTHLEDITTDSSHMSASIEEIASVTEEAAASVEEVAASTNQTTVSMEEVSASAQQLSELSDQLSGNVREFKTDLV
ncbi:methyl-accepting chemotaxis protein [Halobacillus sp. ACCC02827]|uniref:methyl-accepting chemotaxis protein n=1 Tax=Halobacillus sp. ACCC02827 TaxID=3052090 RepID=UPI0025708B37|nr:methyl-accepting chemotaxis protein [Halobacillus sp. ACCC02827]WJE14942.1 methyl-accepting chemotaxis protein [Halobacillus sp. ACCC02827]